MSGLTQTQGSLTIVDFNDAPMLQAAIDVTGGTPTQVYVSDTSEYSTGNDWSTTSLDLVPRLYKSGATPQELCADAGELVVVNWFQNFTGSWVAITDTADYSLTNSGRGGLSITDNVLGVVTKQGKIKAEITYTDSLTGLSVTAITILDVNVIGTQLGSVALILTTDNGLTFKNGAVDSNQSITVTAALLRGSTEDTTDLTYVWAQDGDVIAGETTSTLTRTPADVFSKAVISCTASDSVLGDSYSNSLQILDVTDPIQVNISSDIGNIFKVGEANMATLTSTLYQNGYPISTPAGAGYLWVLLDKLGSATSWTGYSGVTEFIRTGSGSLGSNKISIDNSTGIFPGYDVTGTGVPVGTKVNRVDGTTLYITENLTTTGTSYGFKLDNNEMYSSVNTKSVTNDDITVRGTVVAKVFF